MGSCTPLSTKELLPAVCQDVKDDTIKPVEDIDEELVLEICQNLLVIDPNRKVWIPSHLSVIEYFENHHWTQKQANCLVASVCLLLLNDPTHYDREDELERNRIQNNSSDHYTNYSLSLYARHHWMIHVQNNGEEDIDDRLSALLKRFLGSPMDSSAAYRSWHRMIEKDDYERPSSSYFSYYRSHLDDLGPASSTSFAICAFRFYTILLDWWDTPWTEYVQRNKRGNSLLQLAAIAGSVSICGRLIDWGAEVNEQHQIGQYGSALAAAASRGNVEVIRLLIESGADVNAQLQVGDNGSALAAAAAAWGGNKEIAQLLIESGADVNAQLQVGDYGSALAAAAWGGNKEIAQLLIESGADVNAQLQVGEYGSALAAAVARDNKETVQLLIESGANMEASQTSSEDIAGRQGLDFS
jgi:ankyrin repeat domain-containing protein 50